MDDGFLPDSPQHDIDRLREIIRDFATVIDATRPGLRYDLLDCMKQLELEVERIETGEPIPEEYVAGDLWRRWNGQALHVAEEAIEEAQWDTRDARFIQAGMENGYIVPSGQALPRYVWMLDVAQLYTLWEYLKAEGWELTRLCSMFLDSNQEPVKVTSVKSMVSRADGVAPLLPRVFAEALEERGYCRSFHRAQG